MTSKERVRRAVKFQGPDRVPSETYRFLDYRDRLEYLRGHENAWTDPCLHPDELGRLLDRPADVAIYMPVGGRGGYLQLGYEGRTARRLGPSVGVGILKGFTS